LNYSPIKTIFFSNTFYVPTYNIMETEDCQLKFLEQLVVI